MCTVKQSNIDTQTPFYRPFSNENWITPSMRPVILTSTVVRQDACWHDHTVEGGQTGCWILWSSTLLQLTLYPAAKVQHSSSHMVSANLLLGRLRAASCKSAQTRSCQISYLWMWPWTTWPTCAQTKFNSGLWSFHDFDDGALNCWKPQQLQHSRNESIIHVTKPIYVFQQEVSK